MDYIKIDENTLSVTKPVEVKEETHEYTLDFLKQQEIQILKQKNDYVEARDKELSEVRTLISEAEKLGIKERPSLEAETLKEIIK
jgi:hypothetical protein